MPTYFKKAIDDLVIYNRISDRYSKQNAKGITLYLPYSSVNLHTLNNYRNIGFSPYWLKYMEWMVERNFLNDMSKYKATNWENSSYFFENDFNFINYDIIIT